MVMVIAVNIFAVSMVCRMEYTEKSFSNCTVQFLLILHTFTKIGSFGLLSGSIPRELNPRVERETSNMKKNAVGPEEFEKTISKSHNFPRTNAVYAFIAEVVERFIFDAVFLVWGPMGHPMGPLLYHKFDNFSVMKLIFTV